MAKSKDSDDQYSPKEAAERFVAALRGSRATGHKPMTDIPRKRVARTELTAEELEIVADGLPSIPDFIDYTQKLASLDPKTANLRLLWIACGTEDNLIRPNRKLVDFLKTKEMPVTQIETPGLHTWLVWRDNLIHFTPLLFQQK